MITDTISVFLEKFKGKTSTNKNEGLSLALRGKRKLLPYDDTSSVISQTEQYRRERLACNTIRLTCQVNPVCSNVLFNRITEIVKDEGSSGVSFVNYGIGEVSAKGKDMSFWSGNAFSYIDSNNNPKNVQASGCKHPTNAIRDTQLSNQGFVYHCGLDILNNHLIRSNTFKAVCGMGEYGDSFNTIADTMRDVFYKDVPETVPLPNGAYFSNEKKIENLHLYGIDDILTFDEAVDEKLLNKYNGWVGFRNKSKIKTYKNFESIDEASLEIERPLMYYSGGDFVDMYPDRSLYSFVPKYNPFRKRIEKNWNYCITYPSSSFTPSSSSDTFSEVIDYELNSLKAVCFNENTRQDNGVRQIVIYSTCKHGLTVGDYVNVYKSYTVKNEEGETNRVNDLIIENAEVTTIADDFIFTVFAEDTQISNTWVSVEEAMSGYISGETDSYLLINDEKYDFNNKFLIKRATGQKYPIIAEEYINLDDTAQDISYKKVVNGVECDYYVSIFSRLPNFKFASGDTSNEYEIYRDRGGYNMIDVYGSQEYDFESHVSRLAFAKNIYSDDIGQIVFTDDINIGGLKDNLDRPLTSIYMTIVKNNAGYKDWYGFRDNWSENMVSSSTVEYSHCFGKIKCGFEMSYMCTDGYDNNIRKITYEDGQGLDIEAINGKRNDVDNDEISFSNDVYYYGDISYFDNYNSIERNIQPIMHRFNTAQRESIVASSSGYFESYLYDEIRYDDYDIIKNFEISVNESKKQVNNKKEGYYYIPHYEIPIRTFGLLQTTMPDFLKMRSLIWEGNGENTVARITTLQNHYLTLGDKSVLYDKENFKYYYCTTVSGQTTGKDSMKVFYCKIYDKSGNQVGNEAIPNLITGMTLENQQYGDYGVITNYSLFKMDNLDAPSYSKILEDGTCRILWRDVLNNGFAVTTNEIEEYPFTNGAFYINKRIDLYLRRQDPYDEYGLYSDDDITGNDVDNIDEDNYYKEDEVEC